MTNKPIRRSTRMRLHSVALDAKLVRTRRFRNVVTEPKRGTPTPAQIVPDAVAVSKPIEAAVVEPEPTAPLCHTSKSDLVIARLQAAQGASIPDLMEATGWQAHSVRGFLSATVRKKRGLNLVSDVDAAGERRYRIDGPVA